MCEDCNWSDAAERITEMLDKCKDIDMERASQDGVDFVDSAKDTLASIGQWAEENEHITDKQSTAVNNLINGLEGWL
jgi:hypothetical protein